MLAKILDSFALIAYFRDERAPRRWNICSSPPVKRTAHSS